MFAVIHHQQHLSRPQAVDQRLRDGATRQDGHPENGGNRGWHERRIRDARQFHQPDPVGVPIEPLLSELLRKAGLSDAAHARKRQERGVLEDIVQLAELMLATRTKLVS